MRSIRKDSNSIQLSAFIVPNIDTVSFLVTMIASSFIRELQANDNNIIKKIKFDRKGQFF